LHGGGAARNRWAARQERPEVAKDIRGALHRVFLSIKLEMKESRASVKNYSKKFEMKEEKGGWDGPNRPSSNFRHLRAKPS
jgi:hypothetical protein